MIRTTLVLGMMMLCHAGYGQGPTDTLDSSKHAVPSSAELSVAAQERMHILNDENATNNPNGLNGSVAPASAKKYLWTPPNTDPILTRGSRGERIMLRPGTPEYQSYINHMSESLQRSMEQRQSITTPVDQPRGWITAIPGKVSLSNQDRIDAVPIMNQQKPRLLALYKKALRRHPDMKGNFTVHMEIEPDGHLTRALITNSDLNDSDLEVALLDVIKTFKFPAKNVQRIDFGYTYNFTPDGGTAVPEATPWGYFKALAPEWPDRNNPTLRPDFIAVMDKYKWALIHLFPTNSKALGFFAVHMQVAADGHVISASQTQSALNDPVLEKQIMKQILAYRFKAGQFDAFEGDFKYNFVDGSDMPAWGWIVSMNDYQRVVMNDQHTLPNGLPLTTIRPAPQVRTVQAESPYATTAERQLAAQKRALSLPTAFLGMGSSIVSTNSVEKSMHTRPDFMSIMNANKNRLETAYMRALADHPALQGSLFVRVKVAPDGHVISANCIVSELQDPELIAEMLKIIQSFEFHAGQSDIVEMNYKYSFFSRRHGVDFGPQAGKELERP